MTVWTLGPEGTFSSEAAQEIFPDAHIEYTGSFERLFQILEESEDSVGVIPIENSLHGSVHEAFDLLYHTDISLWKTHDLRIRHALGAMQTDDIMRIASHPQALAQCRDYLAKNFMQTERFPVSSTTYAIGLAMQDPTTAAIAREDSIIARGLKVLDTNLEGENNTTRFGIVSKKDPYPDYKKTKVSLALHPHKDHPGVLLSLISPFKENDLNMSKIESRPVGSKIGDYVFFIDFEGNTDEKSTQQTLSSLESVADVTLLGVW